MKAVRREDTGPELEVRRRLHHAGLRFRLHVRDLPGSPDIVLPRFRTVVFVHGCFWHGHSCSHGRVVPKTNVEFWTTKIEANRARDARKAKALRRLGWHVERVWECRCRDERALGALVRRIRGRLEAAR
jgi:DNA mismatch endonuclease (patch repair protein)